ncbi:MAG TPA: response regulator, partial [Phenylobacterium sp.]|nr:response regulator [Phenylobacterium sp.]
MHVVDDDQAVRDSAAFLLQVSDYTALTYPSGVAFLEAVGTAEPGCILLDINMPGMSGLEVQAELRARSIAWPVIVLTGRGDVGIAVQAMKNGAFEFLEKPYQNDSLLGSIAEAFDKLESVVAESDRMGQARALIATLTQRELQVMQGLLAAMANKVVAYELDISVRTVEVHRANVMAKLKARGLSTAVRIALAAGVKPLDEHR